MLKIARINTDEEIQNYKIGEQQIGFTCDLCGHKKMIKIKHVEDGLAICEACRRRNGTMPE